MPRFKQGLRNNHRAVRNRKQRYHRTNQRMGNRLHANQGTMAVDKEQDEMDKWNLHLHNRNLHRIFWQGRRPWKARCRRSGRKRHQLTDNILHRNRQDEGRLLFLRYRLEHHLFNGNRTEAIRMEMREDDIHQERNNLLHPRAYNHIP